MRELEWSLWEPPTPLQRVGVASSFLQGSLVSSWPQRHCGLEVGLKLGSDSDSQRDLEQDSGSGVH